jgi:hypothetical protein
VFLQPAEVRDCQPTVQVVQASIQSQPDGVPMVLVTIHPAHITGLPQVIQALPDLQALNREVPTHQDHLPTHQDHLPDLLPLHLLVPRIHLPAEDKYLEINVLK